MAIRYFHGTVVPEGEEKRCKGAAGAVTTRYRRHNHASFCCLPAAESFPEGLWPVPLRSSRAVCCGAVMSAAGQRSDRRRLTGLFSAGFTGGGTVTGHTPTIISGRQLSHPVRAASHHVRQRRAQVPVSSGGAVPAIVVRLSAFHQPCLLRTREAINHATDVGGAAVPTVRRSFSARHGGHPSAARHAAGDASA